MKKIIKYIIITLGITFAILIIGLMLNIVGVINIISSDGYEIEGKSDDGRVTCYVDSNGLLSVNITDPGEYVWRYETDTSTEELAEEKADFDGYHFLIKPSESSGTGYAVVGEYNNKEDTDPDSVGITKFRMEDGKITDILEVVHSLDLKEYDFE